MIRLVDDANVFVLYFDEKGKVIVCNKKISQITSTKRQDLVGKDWFNILCCDNSSPIKQQMFKAVMDDSIRYKRPNNFEGAIVDNEKVERLVSWSITPITTANNELEGILLIGNDITELKEREASLKKIDETLKNIFSNIKEYALFVINLDGNITYYGMGSEALFGWQKNEIIFKHVSKLFTEKDAKTLLPDILEQVKSIGEYEDELELVKKDGLGFPVILSASKFLDTQGNLIGFIFIAKDITERRKLEYQVFQGEKMAAIGQLAAGMAHEINNPLFVISGRLEMLLEGQSMPQEIRDDLNIVNTQADRIRKLVDRLLKFSRKSNPKLEKLNLNEVIEGVLPLLSYHKLPDAKIELEKDFEQGIPYIEGDLNQLQEVFINLFINAYQAMKQGGKLKIKTHNDGNQLEVRISDTGPGVSQQNLKNIFMPFFSTKSDGTGLGLSIVYNIINNHNGTIDIESQVDRGTTFIIKLPLAK